MSITEKFIHYDSTIADTINVDFRKPGKYKVRVHNLAFALTQPYVKDYLFLKLDHNQPGDLIINDTSNKRSGALFLYMTCTKGVYCIKNTNDVTNLLYFDRQQGFKFSLVDEDNAELFYSKLIITLHIIGPYPNTQA
jgi:hypothetical protein